MTNDRSEVNMERSNQYTVRIGDRAAVCQLHFGNQPPPLGERRRKTPAFALFPGSGQPDGPVAVCTLLLNVGSKSAGIGDPEWTVSGSNGTPVPVHCRSRRGRMGTPSVALSTRFVTAEASARRNRFRSTQSWISRVCPAVRYSPDLRDWIFMVTRRVSFEVAPF
jgi:hypothetical protein